MIAVSTEAKTLAETKELLKALIKRFGFDSMISALLDLAEEE